MCQQQITLSLVIFRWSTMICILQILFLAVVSLYPSCPSNIKFDLVTETLWSNCLGSKYRSGSKKWNLSHFPFKKFPFMTPSKLLMQGTLYTALTLTLLMWRIWWANNARKWQIGFNLAFKGLIKRKVINIPGEGHAYLELHNEKSVAHHFDTVVHQVCWRQLYLVW
jgi:hypothetical protein